MLSEITEVSLSFLLRLGMNKNDKHLGEPGLPYMQVGLILSSHSCMCCYDVCESHADSCGHSLCGMEGSKDESKVVGCFFICFLFLTVWVAVYVCEFHNMQIVFDVEINILFGGKEKINSRYKFHFLLFFDMESFIYLDSAVAEDPVAVNCQDCTEPF